MLLAGLKGLSDTMRLLYFSENTIATVVDYKSRARNAYWSKNRVPEYAPVYTFITYKDAIIEGVSKS